MHLTVFGEQTHSISNFGSTIFQPENAYHAAFFSNTVIDLASAPIPPGVYGFSITNAFSNVELYLPRHVNFTIDGMVIFGNHETIVDPEKRKKLYKKLKHIASLPGDVQPTVALEPVPSEAQTLIHINIKVYFANLTIYRV